MSARIDISPSLIHFTKGNDISDAFNNLLSILQHGKLYGSNTWIKGGYYCVCFSEAPLECLSEGLINSAFYSKYSPFGIMVDKERLYRLGGRPVIYQSESEFSHLSLEQRWRHMTYNPIVNPPIDFTWEREWRIQTMELHISPDYYKVVLPNQYWLSILIDLHNEMQEDAIQQYKIALNDHYLAELQRREFPYSIVFIGD